MSDICYSVDLKLPEYKERIGIHLNSCFYLLLLFMFLCLPVAVIPKTVKPAVKTTCT